MNKIVPIISVTVSALCFACAIVGIVTMSIAVTVNGVAILAIPTAIIALAVSMLSGAFDLLFFKSVLCKIAFFINVASFVISVVSIIIWLAVL